MNEQQREMYEALTDEQARQIVTCVRKMSEAWRELPPELRQFLTRMQEELR